MIHSVSHRQDGLWTALRMTGGRIGTGRRDWMVHRGGLGNIMRFSTGLSPVLASGSSIRRILLDGVGLRFEVKLPDVDEPALKRGVEGSSEGLATLLAGAKAVEVSARAGERWVIGSDSIAECDGRRFDKPRDREAAAAHLRSFSGSTLAVISAVVLARSGVVEWRYAERALLKVRALSEGFIESYLDAEWPEVSGCVGVFRMEGRGATLFEAVEGSHFTVLGLPLLPLLGALRERGVIVS